MDTFNFIDIYATKGIEYLIVIAFLVTIVPFFRFVLSSPSTTTSAHREGIWAAFLRKTHLSELQWNPIMAYMKHPDQKEESDAKKDESEKAKNTKK